MSLRDRFRSVNSRSDQSDKTSTQAKPKSSKPAGDGNGKGNGKSVASALNDRSSGLKARIHKRMVERINLANLDSIAPDALRAQIGHIINTLVTEEGIPLSETQRQALEQEVMNETFGLGPIEPLLHDPDVSDILVNTHKQVYIEKYGQLEMTDVKFDDDAHLMKIIDRIVSRIGRRVDESSPMVDARLQDGSRVNAIIPPLALDGPSLSIRRFGVRTLDLGDLMELGSVSPGMGELLKGAIRARLNMLISGGTGSGKTTLLNALSAFIPVEERIVTIEDAAVLQMLQPHVVRLETRPPNIEGRGEITQRDLVRNSLRMRPDRIVVGEVRGVEVLDMLQAMNTGHDGSLTTVHANNPRDALHRLETLMLLSGVNLPPTAMREQISAALDVIIHVARMADGTRRVVDVSEIVGMERDVVAMQEIFSFKKTGISEEGKVLGRYEATGIRPKFADRLEVSGIPVPASLFSEGQVI
ncbi:MAG: CpaF family protein [bacterium]